MGLIDTVLGYVFGGGRNRIKETAEVFRVNAEAADQRAAGMQNAALAQMAAEFAMQQRGLFDRIMDALNRIPRPALALGTIGLFVSAMYDPVWFASRMQGVALVPEPLWWLLGAIVSFYFGARHQAKGQMHERAIAATLAHTPAVVRNIEALEGLKHVDELTPGAADPGADAEAQIAVDQDEDENPAISEWRGVDQR